MQIEARLSPQQISGKLPDKMGTIRKHGASIRASKTPEPVQCPTAPPVGGSSFGKPVAPPTIPPAWQAPPECDIIEDLLNEALPPPSADPEPAQDDGVTSMFTPPPPPPPPDAFVGGMVPLPPPPPPPDAFVGGMVPPPPPPPPPDPTSAPPTSLETVLEENSFPSPSPPPHSDDEILPPPPSDGLELPPPPPADGEVEDLEIPAPPLMQVEFDDFMPPLPPPVDYDAPPQYLEKVVALYSYDASKPDDLSLTEGDIIYLTHRHDDGWCQGVLDGKHGFFPDNYVQSCS